MSRLMTCCARLANVSATESFYEHATESAADLIPDSYPSCELVGIDPPRYLAGHTAFPLPPELYARFIELLPDHPMMRAWLAKGGDGLLWTGPVDTGAVPMRSTAMYEQVFQHVGIEHQVLASVRIDTSRALTLMISSRNPIAVRQRTLLDELRPHLATAFKTWERVQTLLNPEEVTPALVAKRFGLPTRRAEVYLGLSTGLTNDELAHSMGLAASTIRKHLELLLNDLGVDGKAPAVARFYEEFPPVSSNPQRAAQIKTSPEE